MRFEKKILAQLDKCYSVAPLAYHGQNCFLVAAEKQDRCLLFAPDGALLETVWDGPGGVMSMEQLPEGDGAFLATQRFYSPNDGAQASIVVASRGSEGWNVRTLAALPFVHRFGILIGADGAHWLVAATIKSAHAFRDDWTCPGRVWGARLPEDLSGVDEAHPLALEPIASGLYKNHGFCKAAGGACALFGSENGVLRVTPPAAQGAMWSVETLLDIPVSDMTLVDLDADGVEELVVYAPFHGENLSVYRQSGAGWECAWQCDRPLEFLHAIWGGVLNGVPTALVGHRKGARDLLALTCSGGEYRLECIDHDCGPANVEVFHGVDGDRVVAANREIGEIALYQ